MTKQPEALRLADALEDDLHADDGTTLGLYSQGIADNAAAELRRLHEVNQELLEALQTILNISLMDKGHWAKTIEAEAYAAIAKATGEH